MKNITFEIGDAAPWFRCRASNNPAFNFGSAAGRYIVLSFFGSAGNAQGKQLIEIITGGLRHNFDDMKISFFGVSADKDDELQQRAVETLPGIRYFWDSAAQVSMLYGAAAEGSKTYRQFTLVLDPFLRVIANISMNDMEAHNRQLGEVLKALPPIDDHAGVPVHAPVLVLPRVIEPEMCRRLIELYEAQGGKESGFMREKDGNTVEVMDPNFKRRSDFNFDIQEEFTQLRAELNARIVRRLLPEIYKAFQFKVTRIERYVVSCYAGEVGGFFRAHRDNTTKGTAHRKFACTINLNADEYEGGDLRFPEFGTKTYRAPTGGAVVFSCSLLHEATPVTKGERYAFLPFFYDEEGAKIREKNLKYLA